MSEDTPRWLVLAEVAGVGCLSLAAASVMRGRPEASDTYTLFLATLLLVLACAGFIMKMVRRWSTRLLWEWIFVGATLVGGWILPRTLIPGSVGVVLSALVLFAPLMSQTFWVYAVVCVVGASGAAVLFAPYVPSLSLWTLWVGMAVYDRVAARMLESMRATLHALGERRRVIMEVPALEAAQVRVLLSHVVLPSALIVQAGLRDLREGAILAGALLLGAGYAMMRPKEARPALIVPWAAVWMVGAEALLLLVKRLS